MPFPSTFRNILCSCYLKHFWTYPSTSYQERRTLINCRKHRSHRFFLDIWMISDSKSIFPHSSQASSLANGVLPGFFIIWIVHFLRLNNIPKPSICQSSLERERRLILKGTLFITYETAIWTRNNAAETQANLWQGRFEGSKLWGALQRKLSKYLFFPFLHGFLKLKQSLVNGFGASAEGFSRACADSGARAHAPFSSSLTVSICEPEQEGSCQRR